MQHYRRPANPFYAARQAARTSATYKVLDLFSGIGGFSLGLQRAGFQTVAFCEIDTFCRQILQMHWPETPVFDDITKLSGKDFNHATIDIITGGYPCQPFSVAGRQRGEHDPRHLWPHMYRIIREIRPRWVICENVSGHVRLGLDTVLSQLESCGYTCWPFLIPACAFGAPHWRERLWVVANTTGERRVPRSNKFTKGGWVLSKNQTQHADKKPSRSFEWLPEPTLDRVDDGFSDGMDRLHSLGNAVVPQVTEFIGHVIIAHEARQYCLAA